MKFPSLRPRELVRYLIASSSSIYNQNIIHHCFYEPCRLGLQPREQMNRSLFMDDIAQ